MSIIKGKEYLYKDIYSGRNSEWFSNLQKRSWNEVYKTLPASHGVPEECPEDILLNKKIDGYYGFMYIKVKEMMEWLEEMTPWVDAGWFNSYEKWSYEKRGILIEEDFPRNKPAETDEPYYFVEYEKKYDSSKWLYDFIIQRYTNINGMGCSYLEIPEDDILVYYFDC